MPPKLRSCAVCARHVRASEVTCPFCAGRPRAGRAAVALVAGAAVSFAAACGGSTSAPPPEASDASAEGGASDAAADAGPDVTMVPLLDAAPPPVDANRDDTGIRPVYGAPPFPSDGGAGREGPP